MPFFPSPVPTSCIGSRGSGNVGVRRRAAHDGRIIVRRWLPPLLLILQTSRSVAQVCPYGEPVTAFYAAGEVQAKKDDDASSAYGDYGRGEKVEQAKPQEGAGGKTDYDDASSAYGGGAYMSYGYYGFGYGGYYDYGQGEACTPSKEECYKRAKVVAGPDVTGYYAVEWEDGATLATSVHHNQVKRVSDGTVCGIMERVHEQQVAATSTPPRASPPTPPPPHPPQIPVQQQQQQQQQQQDASSSNNDDAWVPPEIPCTLMPRLHWEGSDPAFNLEAVASMKAQYQPSELIDGFDWHVIMRFNDVNECEKAYKDLEAKLKECKDADPEKCRTHKYVKAVEYVGDDPEQRRKTGRSVFKPAAGQQGKQRSEL